MHQKQLVFGFTTVLQDFVGTLHEGADEKSFPGFEITQDIVDVDDSVPDVQRLGLAMRQLFRHFVLDRHVIKVDLCCILRSQVDDLTFGRTCHVGVVRTVLCHVLSVKLFDVLDPKNQI